MTGAGALALTGVVFLIAAVVFAIAADTSRRSTRGRLVALGWTTFTLAASAFIGAAWWQSVTS